MSRPADTESQFDAAIVDTSMSIPFVKLLVDTFDRWLGYPIYTEIDTVKPQLEPELEPVIKKQRTVRRVIKPIQPKKSASCPAIYQGAAAFSPVSEDGEFFFADLPSPASAP